MAREPSLASLQEVDWLEFCVSCGDNTIQTRYDRCSDAVIDNECGIPAGIRSSKALSSVVLVEECCWCSSHSNAVCSREANVGENLMFRVEVARYFSKVFDEMASELLSKLRCLQNQIGDGEECVEEVAVSSRWKEGVKAMFSTRGVLFYGGRLHWTCWPDGDVVKSRRGGAEGEFVASTDCG